MTRINATRSTTIRRVLTIGWATAGHMTGRAVNVLTPLLIVGLHGAETRTDRFFFLMAIAFFFHGTLGHALTTTTVPLMISGRIRLSSGRILQWAAGCCALTLAAALIAGRMIASIDLVYAAALALMAGAGLANGLAAGVWNARERFGLPGLTWALRLVPLFLYFSANPTADMLPWLALGLAAADWTRCAILLWGAPFQKTESQSSPFAALITSYGTILLASLIMGVNPIIDRLIAGIGGPGEISILETGERLYGILAGMATLGLMPVLLTYLSQKAAGGELNAAWKSVIRKLALWSGVWLALGIAIGYLDLLRLTALSDLQAYKGRQVYWCYLAGLPTFIFLLAHIRRLQATGHLKLLVLAAGLTVILNIPLSLMLRAWMGVAGIALATTLVYAFDCLVFWRWVKRISTRDGRVSPGSGDD